MLVQLAKHYNLIATYDSRLYTIFVVMLTI